MAEIKAFRGMRYNTEKAGEISQLCCPPYDIISEEQRLGYISENEYNIILKSLKRESFFRTSSLFQRLKRIGLIL